jgi:hypothetical protein
MAKPLRDNWDSDGGSSGPEAVSWKTANPGDVFTGIAVAPEPVTAPNKGYAVSQRNGKSSLNRGVGAPQGPLFWRPSTMEKGGPVHADEYYRNGGREEDMEGVSMHVLTLVTDYKNKEYFSGKAHERASENPEFVDDGLRRYFIDGPDIPTKFEDALKAAGMKRGLLAGSRVAIRLDRREPNKSGQEGETNRFSVKIEAPTPETLKVAEAYAAEVKAGASSAGVQDNWAKSDEPPPF